MDIRRKLGELCKAFNTHDLDRIMAFFSDDCILEMPKGNEPWGLCSEGKRNALPATRFEGLPDVHYGSEEHFVDPTADTGISKWTLTGTTSKGQKSMSGVATSTRFATARWSARIHTGKLWSKSEMNPGSQEPPHSQGRATTHPRLPTLRQPESSRPAGHPPNPV
jgi:ketosteroid isomerase-like protein